MTFLHDAGILIDREIFDSALDVRTATGIWPHSPRVMRHRMVSTLPAVRLPQFCGVWQISTASGIH
jgi:hypothetical protein